MGFGAMEFQVVNDGSAGIGAGWETEFEGFSGDGRRRSRR